MATLTGGSLDALRERLKRIGSGSIKIVDAQVDALLDRDGDEYVQVTLIVSEPPAGRQTWSLEDAFQVRQAVRRVAAESGFSDSLAVTMTMAGESGTEDERDDDDDDPTEPVGDGQ